MLARMKIAGRSLTLVVPLLLAGGCLRDDRAQRERGASGLFETAAVVPAPSISRCERMDQPAVRSHCNDALLVAQVYARKLAVGDEVCLEGGFGTPPTARCLARAAVVDTAADKVLVELRDARPGSTWFEKIQHQVWFQEGALVDLYLAESGY
jgi:hypothetical protein